MACQNYIPLIMYPLFFSRAGTKSSYFGGNATNIQKAFSKWGILTGGILLGLPSKSKKIFNSSTSLKLFAESQVKYLPLRR